jgi:hypothetical protein
VIGRLQLIAGAGVAMAIAGLLVRVYALRADLARAGEALAARDHALIAANRSLVEKDLALSFKDLEISLNRSQVAAGDAAEKVGSGIGEQLRATLKQGKSPDASPDHDPLAGPVLVDAAVSLRRFAAELGAVRTGAADQTASVPGDPGAAGAAGDPWPRLKPPFRQSAFRDACFDLADALSDTVGQLAGIRAWQDQYNANIRKANAAAAAGVAR